MKRQLIITAGLPGAGKSRWARRERRKPETFVFSSRAIVQQMCSRDGDPVMEGYAEALGPLLRVLAEDQSKMTTRLIVDSTNHERGLRNAMIALGAETDREVICETFDVPKDLCEIRSKLSETKGGRLIFAEIASRWEQVLPSEGFAGVHYHHGRRTSPEVMERGQKRRRSLLSRLRAMLKE